MTRSQSGDVALNVRDCHFVTMQMKSLQLKQRSVAHEVHSTTQRKPPSRRIAHIFSYIVVGTFGRTLTYENVYVMGADVHLGAAESVRDGVLCVRSLGVRFVGVASLSASSLGSCRCLVVVCPCTT